MRIKLNVESKHGSYIICHAPAGLLGEGLSRTAKRDWMRAICEHYEARLVSWEIPRNSDMVRTLGMHR